MVIRYDTRSYFNVRSKADISQLNLPHGKRGRSGLVVSTSDCGVRRPLQVRITPRAVVLSRQLGLDMPTPKNCLGHGLCTLTTVLLNSRSDFGNDDSTINIVVFIIVIIITIIMNGHSFWRI